MKTIILCGLLAALALVLVPPDRSAAKPVEDVVLLIEEPAESGRLDNGWKIQRRPQWPPA